ncbi:MAG: hypothetical protein SPE38_06210 [Prevotella sp.]|nr:hypothetical protein [Prevotella sp.]
MAALLYVSAELSRVAKGGRRQSTDAKPRAESTDAKPRAESSLLGYAEARRRKTQSSLLGYAEARRRKTTVNSLGLCQFQNLMVSWNIICK